MGTAQNQERSRRGNWKLWCCRGRGEGLRIALCREQGPRSAPRGWAQAAAPPLPDCTAKATANASSSDRSSISTKMCTGWQLNHSPGAGKSCWLPEAQAALEAAPPVPGQHRRELSACLLLPQLAAREPRAWTQAGTQLWGQPGTPRWGQAAAGELHSLGGSCGCRFQPRMGPSAARGLLHTSGNSHTPASPVLAS